MPMNLDDNREHLISLPGCRGMPASVHIFDKDSILAVNAALAASRPLLVRGEPGTGKSQLARAAAVVLGRAFLVHAVDARTETRDLLWTVDAVARLAEAQVLGALRDVSPAEARHRIEILNFVHPGPLWWAFDWTSAAEQAARAGISAPEVQPGWQPENGVVVLIDEIDKADPSVPNGLLDALGHGCFDVPGRAQVSRVPERAPLVVITTNEERALPDAFLRRCLVLQLELPEDKEALKQMLVERGRAHFPACAAAVLQRAAELLADDREKLRQQELLPPGIAEYIDLVRAVTQQAADPKAQQELLKKISKFALCKHPVERAR